MSSKSGVAAVDRALSILGAYDGAKPRLTLAELSQRTGLYKSTILRLIGSLERFGYLRQLSDGRYQVGPKVAELASIFQDAFNMRDFVQPVLEEIVVNTNEAASFFVRDGHQQICVFRVDGRHPIRDHHIRVGDRWDLDKGATAQIFLKFEGRTSFDATLENMTVASFGHKHPDSAGIAAAVFGSDNRLAGALIISGPITRFTEERARVVATVATQQAARLSMSLGADFNHFQGLLDEMLDTEFLAEPESTS